jgi:hypothetical protein
MISGVSADYTSNHFRGCCSISAAAASAAQTRVSAFREKVRSSERRRYVSEKVRSSERRRYVSLVGGAGDHVDPTRTTEGLPTGSEVARTKQNSERLPSATVSERLIAIDTGENRKDETSDTEQLALYRSLFTFSGRYRLFVCRRALPVLAPLRHADGH